VVTTVVHGAIVSGACNAPGDLVTIDLTVNYNSTANQRYDLGVFLSTNGTAVVSGSSCVGAAPTEGTGDPTTFTPPGTGNFFESLDPSHTPTDTCGDLDSAELNGVNWTVRTTVECIPNDQNQLVIQSCRVWQQNANHAGSC